MHFKAPILKNSLLILNAKVAALLQQPEPNEDDCHGPSYSAGSGYI
jgi:hypothetical protein